MPRPSARRPLRGGVAGFALLLLALPVAARPAQPPRPDPLAEYHVRLFGVGHGLPSTVWGVVQRTDARLYVATALGLYDFDGFRFSPVASDGLGDFRNGFVDRRDRIWVVSRTNRIGLLDGRTFRLLPPPPGYETGAPARWNGPDALRAFSETLDGTVWALGGRGLIRIDPDAPRPFTRYGEAAGLDDPDVVGLFDLGPDGERVVVSRTGTYRMDAVDDGAGATFRRIGPPCVAAADPRVGFDPPVVLTRCREGDREFVVEIRPDSAVVHEPAAAGAPDLFDSLPPPPMLGRTFMGGVRVSTAAVASTPDAGFLPDPPGRRLRARDGTWWAAVRDTLDRDQLVRWNGSTGSVLPLRDHVEFQVIRSLFEDHEGSVWVATDAGVVQLTRRGITTLGTADGLAAAYTTSILESPAGTLWVGTWGGGVHRIGADGPPTRIGTAEGLPSERVRALLRSRDGTLWVGTDRGLATLDDDRRPRTVWAGPTIRALAETRDGGFWIGTERVLARAASTEALLRGEPVDTALEASVWGLHERPDSTFWIASEAGLFTVRDSTVVPAPGVDAPPGTVFVGFREEAGGALWVSTHGQGLFRIRDGVATHLTPGHGLPVSGLWAQVEDGDGGLWATSDRGLFRIGVDGLEVLADAVEEGRGPPWPPFDVVAFGEADGLPGPEFNRASPPGIRASDGRLWFNNTLGLVIVDPERAGAPGPAPHVTLDSVRVDGSLTVVADPATLPARFRRASFEFSARTYAAPELTRYRYRLDGYDDDWVPGGTERRAVYTHLPPGRYTLDVEARNGSGGWGEAAHMAVVVPPALWQTAWMRLGLMAAVVLVLWALHRARVRQAVAMDRMRFTIAADLHDDLGSNLSSIAMLADILGEHRGLGERERNQLQRIGDAANQTVQGLRDVIWLVDPRQNHLQDLVDRMRRTMIGTPVPVDFEVRVAPERLSMPLGLDLMRGAYLVFKEALNNALRHSGARRVRVVVGESEHRLTVLVEDDGRGFDPSTGFPGRGLESMRHRAEAAGGRLDLDSRPGRGTSVSFAARIP